MKNAKPKLTTIEQQEKLETTEKVLKGMQTLKRMIEDKKREMMKSSSSNE